MNLAKWARADLVRRFQIVGKKYHGTYLSVSINKGSKKRRRLGVFQKEFIITKHNDIIPRVSLCIMNCLLFKKIILIIMFYALKTVQYKRKLLRLLN